MICFPVIQCLPILTHTIEPTVSKLKALLCVCGHTEIVVCIYIPCLPSEIYKGMSTEELSNDQFRVCRSVLTFQPNKNSTGLSIHQSSDVAWKLRMVM